VTAPAGQDALTAATVKAKARALGADLVGIAAGALLDAHPPDPARPQTPSGITREDARSVVVLARRLLAGLGRLQAHDDRHKQYATELTISDLEEIQLKLVYFLEDHGHPAITVPPVHVDPRHYDRDGDTRGPLSLPHAAVEAGLGTLGLNLMLLTPEFGPRVILGAVLTSAPLEPDRPLAEPLCLGEACGRCLLACPGDAIRQWALDKRRCAPYASPYGFAYLMDHLDRVVKASPNERIALLKSKESFMAWQSILRGVGVYSGCTRCVDVCPVGADYEAHLADAQAEIPERTPEKEARLRDMAARREAGDRGPHFGRSARWIDGPRAVTVGARPGHTGIR
jgi:epoxyqueuosine reductase